ncbi:MAG: TIGR04086 family membrane protein [Agathobacter sp.]
MKNIKHILLSILVMMLTSLVTLCLLSLLIYLFKWQAPLAMKGITLTYILSGLSGGILYGGVSGRLELRDRLIRGVTLGTDYMLLLLLLSLMVTGNMNWDMTRLLMIWVLLSCSSVLGIFLGTTFVRKHRNIFEKG